MRGVREINAARLIVALIAFRPWLYGLTLVLWLGVEVAPVLPGLILRAFFDRLAREAQAGLNIPTLAALAIAVGAARLGLILWAYLGDARFRFAISSLLRRNLLAFLLRRPDRLPPGLSVGEVVSRFRDDVDQVEQAVDWILDTLGKTLFALVALAILLRTNVPLTLAVFTPLVLVVALAYAAGNRVERFRRAARAASGRYSSALGEVLGTVQAVQVAGAETGVLNYLRRLGEARRTTNVRDQVFSQSLNAVFQNTVSLGTGLLLILVGGEIRSGGFSVGDFALFVYYLGFVTGFTEFFGGFLAYYRQTRVAFTRLVELTGSSEEALVAHAKLHLEGPLPETQVSRQGEAEPLEVLEVRGLTKRFGEGEPGIEDVSFTLPRGSFTVITGRVGSGKTTLLRTLLGLLPVDGGQVYWNGQKVADHLGFFGPPRSAYTPQVPALLSASLRENILLGIPEGRTDLAGAIRAAVLERDIQALPQGLDTFIGVRGTKLSGGQAQRTAAARMFARKAQLYVFDDLSSALDVETEQTLLQCLLMLPRVTLLVVSHRRVVFQQADQIIVLKGGRVEGYGSLSDLISWNDEMKLLWSGHLD